MPEPPLQSRDVQERTLDGVVLTAARGLLIRLLGFAASIVLARLLTPRDFGLVAFGVALIAFGTALSDGGLGAGLVRRREEPSVSDLEVVVGFQFAMTLIVAVLLVPVAMLFGEAGGLTAVMVASLPFLAFRVPGAVILERSLDYRPIVAVEVAETLAYTVTAVVLAALGLGAWALAVAVVARSVAGTVGMLTFAPVRVRRPRFEYGKSRALLAFGLRYQAIGLVNLVRDQGTNIGLAVVAGFSVLGLWALGQRVLQVALTLLESFRRVSFPGWARLAATGEDATPVVERSIRLTAVATGVVIVALVGSAPALIPALFGSRWTQLTDLLPLSGLALMIAGPIGSACLGFLFASGATKPPLRAAIVQAAVMLGVILPLAPRLGIVAVGLGHVAGATAEAWILGRATAARTDARIFTPLAAPLVAAAITGMAGWLLCATLPPTLPVGAGVAALCAAAFMAILTVSQRHAVHDFMTVTRRGVRSVTRRRGAARPAPV